MKHEPIKTQKQLGARLAEARRSAGLTQEQLAQRIGLDRSAVSRVESGTRRIDAIELVALANVVSLPLDWLLEAPTPAVVSQRASVEEPAARSQLRAEALTYELARDMELLLQLGVLHPPARRKLESSISRIEEAESAASQVRDWLEIPDEPLLDLPACAEQLGLYSVAEDRGPDLPEGTYQDIGSGGIAWIDGRSPAGRRRFTLAHELGHHVLEDEYRLDWDVQSEETEKVVNAFAIHLLLPRHGVLRCWGELARQELDLRSRAIWIAARYGVSWSAACAQLRRLGALTAEEQSILVSRPPRLGDYVALQVNCPEELVPPFLSPRLSAAIVQAFRKRKLSASRSVELLRGTLTAEELPELSAAAERR